MYPPPRGERWLARIETAISKLADDAARWPEADEANLLGRDLRSCLVGRGRHVYRILFLIDADRVIVVQVRHAAQDSITEVDL